MVSDFAEAINSNFEQLGRMIDTVILPRFDASWEQCAHSSLCTTEYLKRAPTLLRMRNPPVDGWMLSTTNAALSGSRRGGVSGPLINRKHFECLSADRANSADTEVVTALESTPQP